MVDIKKGVKVCKIHVIKCNCFKRNLGNKNTNFFKLIFGYCLHACKIPLLYLIQSRLLFCSFSACLHFLWFAIKVKVGDLCNKVMIIYIQFSVLYSENGCFFFLHRLYIIKWYYAMQIWLCIKFNYDSPLYVNKLWPILN